MIRIVIADDHAMMRACLRQIITSAGDMAVCGEAANGIEVMDLVRKTGFDVLILDMNMPGNTGVELIERVRLERPDLPILVLSMQTEGPFVARALKAGAMAYIAKGSEPDILLSALRKVAIGQKAIDPCLVNELVFESMPVDEHPHHVLSDRELQVLQMFARGKTVTQVAKVFCLSPKTVSTHKANIKEKLGFQADADLIRYAIQHRL